MSKVGIVTPAHLRNNKLFDINSARDRCLERFSLLRQQLNDQGVACDTIDLCEPSEIDVLVCSDVASSLKEILQTVRSNPYVRLMYLPTEPPVVCGLHENSLLELMPFDRILFWNDDFVQRTPNAVKCNIGQPVIDAAHIPNVPFAERKFLVAIYSNKMIRHANGLYEERQKAFDFFASMPHGMDLYGMGWESSTRPSIRDSYNGSCKSKKDVMQGYRFALCFENATGYRGLVTEKIFDCFAAGTVPIYYGAPNITEYITDDCFIDFRWFDDYEHLYSFLVNMEEGDYQRYLDAAKNFIRTQQYYEFTSKRYADVVLNQIHLLLKQPGVCRTALGFKKDLMRIVLTHPLYFIRHFMACRNFLKKLALVW